MTDIVILVRASKDDEGRPILRHRGALYDVLHEGQLLLGKVRFPFYDSARALMKRGCDPNARLSMRWEHEPHTTSMIGPIGYAATRTIVEGVTKGPMETAYAPPSNGDDV